MPKGFTEHEKELIGQQLLEQGYKLFSAYGLKKTNVEEIARAAGISKGAFYNFYESKEALFMDVIEQAEMRVRQEILSVINLPGPSPRARMFAVLKKAFDVFMGIPILRFFTGSDFDLLFRRIPPQKLKDHLINDKAFIVELVRRCQEAGIPIQVQPDQITALLYPLVPGILHQDDLFGDNYIGSIDLLLELIAAFCLGEVDIQLQNAASRAPDSEERSLT